MKYQIYLFIFLFILSIIIVLFYHKLFYIKSGTILFSIENDDSEFIQAVSDSAIDNTDNLPINHVALALEKNRIMEATPENGVALTKYRDFLKRSRVVLAVKIKNRKVEENALKNAKLLLGKKYNFTFEPEEDGLYCSQLITESFLYDNGDRYFSLHPMNFLNEKGELIPYWIEYYKKYNKEIPQGVEGSHPKQLFLQKHLFEKISILKH